MTDKSDFLEPLLVISQSDHDWVILSWSITVQATLPVSFEEINQLNCEKVLDNVCAFFVLRSGARSGLDVEYCGKKKTN